MALSWEEHLSTMIIADKYSLPKLETLAFQMCKEEVMRLAKSDGNVLHLIRRSWDYPDRDGPFPNLIADLPQASGDGFPKLFEKCDEFRQWVEANPKVTNPLVARHFSYLVKKPIFGAKLSDDGDMALEHLDRL